VSGKILMVLIMVKIAIIAYLINTMIPNESNTIIGYNLIAKSIYAGSLLMRNWPVVKNPARSQNISKRLVFCQEIKIPCRIFEE